MKNRNLIYWLCQLGGWGFPVLGILIVSKLRDDEMFMAFFSSALILFEGILITHFYRSLIHKFHWKERSIPALIPLMLISSLLMGTVFMILGTAFHDLLFHQIPLIGHQWGGLSAAKFFIDILNFSVLFLLWNIMYFAVQAFQNWKREEIENLELRAAKSESELNSFRAQMNPHFMFNSLNSIKALVDEDPKKAKHAIVMLSGILRNNMSLTKRATVPLREELELMDHYLALEKIRFEERLHVEKQIAPECMSVELPSFMLQTIVENAIKHGVSKLVNGGLVSINCFVADGDMVLEVKNSGEWRNGKTDSGIGLANTAKRLELLYKGKARLIIGPEGDFVVCRVYIPKDVKTDNNK